MKESLRVKDACNETAKQEGVAVKIKENDTNDSAYRRKNAGIAFKEMWADAFLRKKTISIAHPQVEEKQKLPSPYICLRLFLMLVMLFVATLSVFYLFDGYEMYPILISIMILLIPSVLAVFFYEMDTSGRFTLFNILSVLFMAVALALTSKFISYGFIYELHGEAISSFGALAIGLIECVIVCSVCIVFITKYKISDVVTGILIGAIIGVGFGLVNNANIIFRHSFVATEYVPTMKILADNEVLTQSFNSLLNDFLFECILHALNYILAGAVLGGVFVYGTRKGKGQVNIILLVVMILAIWLFNALWVLPLVSVPNMFLYVLRGLMTTAAVIAVVKIIRTGLSLNDYE